MAKTYEQFRQNLLQSIPTVFNVGVMFSEMGYDVFIPAIKVIPKENMNHAEYQDDGDLHVTKDGKTTKINVKQSSRKFSSADDWPFDTFFVSDKKAIDSSVEKNINIYITVSSDSKYAAIVNIKKTRHLWKERTVYEKKYGIQTTVYEIDKNKVKFFKL